MTTAPTTESFQSRHIGPDEHDIKYMLQALTEKDLDSFCKKVIPASLQQESTDSDFSPMSESEALNHLKNIMSQNKLFRSFIGQGYYGTHVPSVIRRNIFENPGWYTQYTPYQAEISQGRLEALMNFQTMISDLTEMPVANASLLDEATAAAEAMAMAFAIKGTHDKNKFFVHDHLFHQTKAVLLTRATHLNIQIVTGTDFKHVGNETFFGAIIQYPSRYGVISDLSSFVGQVHDNNALVVVACDLLALCLFKAPGAWGADICVGSSQRFGVPVGFGGPHAGFLSTKHEFHRKIPGRIVGQSHDVNGDTGYRLSIQTREQHIRREKATSNICTAQVLLAIMASMYAVFHGPQNLKNIALFVHSRTMKLKQLLLSAGLKIMTADNSFDTLTAFLSHDQIISAKARCAEVQINLFFEDPNQVIFSLDETITVKDMSNIFYGLTGNHIEISEIECAEIDPVLSRSSEFLKHPNFNRYHSETEVQRYIKRLENKDLSLTHSMIPLGSCTMKLNSANEMFPVSWDEVSSIHPFVPADQCLGYQQMVQGLKQKLCLTTGFDDISFQPNAGSQGEYAGLLVIKAYHAGRGESHRNICLIPKSAHGTNPASAALAGMEIIGIACEENGNVSVDDLKEKALKYKDALSCLMITYPSTHGVFESSIREICQIIHHHGGQVYLDGANYNAMVGLCKPADFGVDVCHLNLHKTFCIPHGGGGPGMGPICVKKHLSAFLPCHPVSGVSSTLSIGAVSAAEFGSPSILPISWMYIHLMGSSGLKKATQVAILNANYVARRLDPYYPVLYKGESGFVAHECIIDTRQFKNTGIEVTDIAKRLMDYGFHAPTVSFPVPGTLMIEPTESESLEELNRFCDAMIQIRREIENVEKGISDKEDNVLKNAPHTARELVGEWKYSYSRKEAVFPVDWLLNNKFWPPVKRIDGVWGDRNLICTCAMISNTEMAGDGRA